MEESRITSLESLADLFGLRPLLRATITVDHTMTDNRDMLSVVCLQKDLVLLNCISDVSWHKELFSISSTQHTALF